MEQQQFQKQRSYGGGLMEMTRLPSDNDRTTAELRALDCNLTSLCDHVQSEGFNNGSFSDVIVHAMGSTYRLHRLILSRSSYFRNMLHGPWKEVDAPVLNLHVDDNNVNGEAIATALAYLYGQHPKLSDSNAFRVLAAASFFDLQDLCAICTDFIISELWTSNFLDYQVFAESQDYGIHGERVRNACWGYLCQSGALELKEVLPKLSSQTLNALLTSDELWVPTEEKRFELALYALRAKGAFCKSEHSEQGSSSSETGTSSYLDSAQSKGKNVIDGCENNQLESEDHNTAQKILVELVDRVVESHSVVRQQMEQESCVQSNIDPRYASSTFSYSAEVRSSSSYLDGAAMEGPSEEVSCYQLNNNNWLGGRTLNDWGRCSLPNLSWGGRVVGRREVKTCSQGICGLNGEEYDAFVNIFEGGSLLYCNMTFDALLNVRKHLEELGCPCKALNDGLWLQMLLSQRVQEIGADTCRNCCLVSIACACRQPFSRGVHYMQQDQHDNQNTQINNMGNVYVNESGQAEANGLFRPVRVHVRGPIDGLAGIGRGTTFVPTAAWPPTRFVFSRVPFGVGNRNCQLSPGNDDSEEPAGDGLTALVGLSQGVSGIVSGEQADIGGAGGSGIQMIDSTESSIGVEWENASSSISLDMKTPLSHFPPFRFAIEFQDVHRLTDGQVKHSPEVFYAGSLWKVSVQAFNDEDPQGRRTLGLFLHRRKAELNDPLRKLHMYVDSREKVTARYQLICPSKREVMVFGSFKQTGTLLPKAPKGWGWRTALLFDELPDLLQNGSLRVAALVQLI